MLKKEPCRASDEVLHAVHAFLDHTSVHGFVFLAQADVIQENLHFKSFLLNDLSDCLNHLVGKNFIRH